MDALDEATPAGYRSDPALVRACIAGNEAAWAMLVERYGRLVYSIPRGYGMESADADDVFQTVFATLVDHLPRLRDQTRLSAWLITATKRECWRVQGRRPDHAELDHTVAADDPSVLDDITRWEREQAVREAMTTLDPRCRDLLTALFLDPTPAAYVEIAARLGIAVGSIGPTRARCFKKLEAELIARGIEDPA